MPHSKSVYAPGSGLTGHGAKTEPQNPCSSYLTLESTPRFSVAIWLQRQTHD